jgi:hypothetical protein
LASSLCGGKVTRLAQLTFAMFCEISEDVKQVSVVNNLACFLSELGLWGKLVKNILLGYQDICENDKQGLSQGL